MEQLRKILVRMSNDIEKKDEILQKEYNTTNLLKVWKNVIDKAPKRLSKSWNKLLNALQNVLKASYPNQNYFNTKVSQYRKPIKDNDSLDPEIYRQSLIILGRTQEEAIQQSEAYKSKVAARNVDRATYPVLYVEDVFAKMDELIQSNDPYELCLAVALATASRSIEVFKVSKYFSLDGQPNQIKVVGLAKDKGNNNFDNVVLIRNIVHLTAEQVIEAVEEIRSSFEFERKTNQRISSMTNNALNKAFRTHIAPLFHPQDKQYLSTLSSHKCRYIAGYISYLIYGKSKRIPEESYLQAQLGHLSGESTRSYLGINIRYREKIIKHAPDEIKQLFERELKNLADRVEQNCPKQSKLSELNLSQFRNSRRRIEPESQKVKKAKHCLAYLKENGIKVTQRELRAELGFSSKTLTEAYKQARQEKII